MTSWRILISGAAFFLIAGAGIVTEFDALAFVVVYLLFRPLDAPYFLIWIASVQDAPGLSSAWWYPAFVSVGTLMALGYFATHGRRTLTVAWPRDFLLLAAFAVAVVLYGLLSSLAQDLLGGAAQDTSRHPVAVAGLMLMMILSGILTVDLVRLGRLSWTSLGLAAGLAIAYGLLVVAAQLVWGPGTVISASGRDAAFWNANTQLMAETPLGFARLTGSYLTPNGFSLSSTLLLMLIIVSVFRVRLTGRPTVAYVLIGCFVSLVTLSKASVAYFAATAAVLLVLQYGGRRIALGLSALGVVVVAGALLSGLGPKLIGALRIPVDFNAWTATYRAQSWLLIVDSFNFTDWVFGVGLAHWPVLFADHLSFSLSDPHNWLLSIPGTYGVIGLGLYVFLALVLARQWRDGDVAAQWLAFCLFAMFFVRDLVEIPYLIGNTPITYLIWLLLGLLLVPGARMPDESAFDRAHGA